MRGLHLHLDCASGIAGDMTLAALLHAGVPLAVVGDALDAVGAGRDRLVVRPVTKRGIAALDVVVAVEDTGFVAAPRRAGAGVRAVDAGHAHVSYRDLRAKIADAPLAPEVRRRALAMFDLVARAEATIHGSTIETVAFHEVGAVDSVVDIVGTAAALAWLAPASVSCHAVAMGHGTITCAHGVLPVPSPAAVEILRAAGGVMADGGVARELCTPTGAAILAAAVTTWGAPPVGTPVAVGWGAGDADLADRANVVRAVVLAPAGPTVPALWRIEANVDDMSPELCGPALDAALAAGSVDAWWTPVTMKKGRPALVFTALAPGDRRDAVVAAILRETTTIGVRFDPVERRVLDRQLVAVDTAYGPIRIKVARDGAVVVNAAPEHDDCAAAARAHGAPLKQVYAAALAAYAVSSASG